MNVLLAGLLTVLVTALTVTAMLVMRSRSPDGSWFSDGDRASGVFGVLATGFSVLLGFIVFLAFESYDEARSGAASEAELVDLQLETAQLMPAEVRAELTGQLVCYARSVAGPEWEAMVDGTIGDAVNPWGVAMFRTFEATDPRTGTEQSAYDRWADQTADREQARAARVHGAEGLIPFPLWLVLYVVAGLIFVYLLFFADPRERAVTQGLLMGSITVVITLLMLLLGFFDHPHGHGVGKLAPTAMQRTLRVADEEAAAVDLGIDPPCDEDGRPDRG
ncbi:bestrophin-like domain [Cellulomonas sp. URHB0016]